jgi:hypothetical protein
MWPFETSKALTAIVNIANNYPPLPLAGGATTIGGGENATLVYPWSALCLCFCFVV